MKRTGELKRKTPMARTPLSRGKPVQKPRRKVQKAANDERWRSPEYIAWVKSLPCCRCAGPGGDPHHVIGLHWGLSGMGLTAPDSLAMPVCRGCHQAIHNSPELQRWQPEWLRHTISLGARHFDGEIREELRRAWALIDDKEAI